MNQQQTPPEVGQKVFLPELNLYGEIVQIYAAGGELVQTVRVVVNGKPTLIETTFLIVKAAEQVGAIIRLGVVIWGKIKQPLTTLCRTLGICKKKVSLETPAVMAELERLRRINTPSATEKHNQLVSQVLK
jgi:hypothetical protein